MSTPNSSPRTELAEASEVWPGLASKLALLESRRLEVGRTIADFEMAQRFALPYRVGAAQDMIRRVSDDLRASGGTVLQTHLLGDSEAAHVSRLLAFFDLPTNAVVLDAGCGIGGVAQHMERERPDLEFVLLNLSSGQLDLCPDDFRKIHASFEDIPAA